MLKNILLALLRYYFWNYCILDTSSVLGIGTVHVFVQHRTTYAELVLFKNTLVTKPKSKISSIPGPKSWSLGMPLGAKYPTYGGSPKKKI